MTVEMKDGEVLLASSQTLVGYTASEVGGDAEGRPQR